MNLVLKEGSGGFFQRRGGGEKSVICLPGSTCMGMVLACACRGRKL